METRIDTVQFLHDPAGAPAFAVIPYARYRALVKGKAAAKPAPEPGIPAVVVDLAMDNDWSAAHAWREHMELTQTEVARRMGITQGAYAQLEAKKSIRKSSRERIAKALGIHQTQLDF